jgi:CHAT domain-containing protein/tetratricopeptide (TPR) repeat protein
MSNQHRPRLTSLSQNLQALGSILALSVSLAIVRPNIISAYALQRNEINPITLEPGPPIKREMIGGQTLSYLINPTGGQYIQFIIEQRGIDLAVALFAPGSKKLIKVDDKIGTRGNECISMIAEVLGIYRLEVSSHSKDVASGGYEAGILQMRVATEEDRDHIAAQTVFAEGEQLRARGDAESLQRAIKKYEEALSLYRITGAPDREAQALLNMGVIYNDLGEKQKALDYFAQALPIYRALGDRQGEARAAVRVSDVYNDIGEMQKALDYLDMALQLNRSAHDRGGEAAVLAAYGARYNSLGENDKALDYYKRALPLWRAVGDPGGEAKTLGGIGRAYSFLRQHRVALGYYEQALSLERTLGDRRNQAYELHNISWTYYTLGDKQKALDYNRQALSLMQAVGDRRGEAGIFTNLGWISELSGEEQKALDYYNQALPVLRATGDWDGEANTLFRLANLERGRDRLSEACVYIEAALASTESLRTKVANPALRASYGATVQEYHEFYIDLLFRLHQRRPTEGFDALSLQASERARARGLLELLTEAHADIRQGVDTVLLESERTLQGLITAKTDRRIRVLNSKHTEQQATEATKELDELVSAFQEVQSKIRASSPHYAELTQQQTLTLPEIQQLLDDDTMLLEYALGKEHSYLWAVTQASINIFELDVESVITGAAQRVYELLTARTKKLANESPGRREARIAKADADYHAVAAELSHLLLAPVASQLGNKRLAIVTDGALQYIPFAALPVPVISRRGDAETPGVQQSRRVAHSPAPRIADTPLIVEHEIVNLPSASTLALLRRDLEGRKSPTKTVAVFADPVFEATDRRVIHGSINNSSENSGDRAISNSARNKGDEKTGDLGGRSKAINDYLLRTRMIEEGQPLARLPYSRKEAMAIASLVAKGQVKIALNFDVNYQTATSAELGEYRFVHFATHGWLDTAQPELSGILLSLVDKEGRPQENGILRLGDVYNLKLPVDMVALSACETALGKSIKGEGLVGLTRGFMYAGAPRVLASLWKVEEVATAELMMAFYEGVLGKQRLRPAEALRRAQIEMWQRPYRRAPYFWGAFVLQGEWR